MPDPAKRSVDGVTLECVVGDIATQRGFDAVEALDDVLGARP